MSDTIPMVRDEPAFAGGPVTADVHPDEVAEWAAHGWQISDGAAEAVVKKAIRDAINDGELAAKPVADPSIGELRKTAKALGIAVSPKLTAAELTAAIAKAEANG